MHIFLWSNRTITLVENVQNEAVWEFIHYII